MLSESEAEVLQLQEDKFGYSWRKLSNEHEYPRYASIQQRFQREFAEFETFLSDEDLDRPSPNQCEVTYVNMIIPDEVWETHSDLGKIIPSAAQHLTEGFLPQPEQTRYATQYVITGEGGSNVARLYVSAEPSYASDGLTPIFLLKLTVRGAPQGSGMTGVIRTMDLGHEWIVRGFATLTSSEMHRAWRKMS